MAKIFAPLEQAGETGPMLAYGPGVMPNKLVIADNTTVPEGNLLAGQGKPLASFEGASFVPSVPKMKEAVAVDSIPKVPAFSQAQPTPLPYYIDRFGQKVYGESEEEYAAANAQMGSGMIKDVANTGITLWNLEKLQQRIFFVDPLAPLINEVSPSLEKDLMDATAPTPLYKYSNSEQEAGAVLLDVATLPIGAEEAIISGGSKVVAGASSLLARVGVFGKAAEVAKGAKGIANKISLESATQELDPFIAKKFASSITENPVSARTYSQILSHGTKVSLDFSADIEPGLYGATLKNKNVIEIYMRNNKNVEEAVSTFVHEGAHISRYFKGFKLSTQYEEYFAMRREFLFRNGYRPSLIQRENIWNQVLKNYEDLPVGKIPMSNW